MNLGLLTNVSISRSSSHISPKAINAFVQVNRVKQQVGGETAPSENAWIQKMERSQNIALFTFRFFCPQATGPIHSLGYSYGEFSALS